MSAERLREAADRLDALTAAATPGPWVVGSRSPATGGNYFGNPDPEVIGASPVGDAGESDAEYIATMGPSVGKALAAWLRAVARSGTGAHLLPALAVADEILSGSTQ